MLRELLLSLGVNPDNASILLPLTPGGSSPPGLRELYIRGLLIINWDDPGKSVLNRDPLSMVRLAAERFNEGQLK